MMAPSTMLSAGTGSVPNAVILKPFPAGLSSTAFTALEPMSRPTTDFFLPKPNINTPLVREQVIRQGQRQYQTSAADRTPKTDAQWQNVRHGARRAAAPVLRFRQRMTGF